MAITSHGSTLKDEHVLPVLASLLLSILVLLLASGIVQAQDVNGRFTLPFTAHWGTVVAPAGDYRISLVSGSISHPSILYVQGKASSFFVMVMRSEQGTSSSQSHLNVLKLGNAYYIKNLESKESGITIWFHLPKDAARQQKDIPILTAGSHKQHG
ncbi:MAG TPA: hypothetical protein VKW70_01675 [Terriglobia bacterium]|nr:hypothetical protein [Terriglobia bacterium]